MSSKARARLLLPTQVAASDKPSCPAKTFPSRRAAPREHHGRDRANFPSPNPQENRTINLLNQDTDSAKGPYLPWQHLCPTPARGVPCRSGYSTLGFTAAPLRITNLQLSWLLDTRQKHHPPPETSPRCRYPPSTIQRRLDLPLDKLISLSYNDGDRQQGKKTAV